MKVAPFCSVLLIVSGCSSDSDSQKSVAVPTMATPTATLSIVLAPPLPTPLPTATPAPTLAASPTLATNPAAKIHSVTYKITAINDDRADVHYRDASGAIITLDGVSVPWSTSFQAPSGTTIGVSARCTRVSGTATYEVIVDGKQVHIDQSTGPHDKAFVETKLY